MTQKEIIQMLLRCRVTGFDLDRKIWSVELPMDYKSARQTSLDLLEKEIQEFADKLRNGKSE